MRSKTKWLLLVGLASSSLALVHCVGDEPAAGGDDGGSGDSGTPDNFVPPGDGGSTDSGSDAGRGACASSGIACATGSDPCVVQIAGAGPTFCARDTDCNLYCWGGNGDGQLGTNPSTTPFSATPLKVNLGGRLSAGVDVGSVSSLDVRGESVVCSRVTAALGTSNTVMCWGANSLGQLGVVDAGPERDDASLPMRAEPAPVPGLTNIGLINAGSRHVCAMTSANLIDCWGDNTKGELGRVTTGTFDPTPAAVVGVPTPAPVADGVIGVGFEHTCIVGSAARVLCVGDDQYGQLGSDAGSDSYQDASFGLITGLTNIAGVSSNGNSNCAISNSGVISCWGRNDHQQMGNDTGPAPQYVPTPPTNYGSISAGGVQAGGTAYCANLGVIGTQPNIQCWGENDVGQIVPPGDGGDVPTPTSLNGLPNGRVFHLALGSKSSCALMGDGTVWCWGENIAGVLGNRDLGGAGNDGTIKLPTRIKF